MPRKGKGRSMRRYMKGSVDEELALGALAANTAITAAFDSAVAQRTLMSSLVATWSMGEHTAGEGPIVVGVAHSDYNAAEIQEWIDSTGTWDEGDRVARELATRLIREVGVFPGAAGQEALNDGKPIKTKLNWILNDGDTLDVWAFNRDDSTLTTGTDIQVSGHANLFPTG